MLRRADILKFLFAGFLLLLASCQSKTDSDSALASRQEGKEADVRSFPYPEIPAILTSPEERRGYLLQHYWDGFDFADTTLVNRREVTEQGVADFLALLSETGREVEQTARQSMENFCAAMEGREHARKVMMKMMDDYLYDPNSPYYNETLYRLYLQRMVRSKRLDEAVKSRLRFLLELTGRNNPGTKATDFTYRLPDGQRRKLSQTPVRGNRLLLLFYDPECPTCHEVLQQMTTDPALAEAVAAGHLTVLAIYTEGNETVWHNTCRQMPDGWIVGNDRQQVKDHALYDLKAMPSLYLLDATGQVLLKDAPYEAIRIHYSSDNPR